MNATLVWAPSFPSVAPSFPSVVHEGSLPERRWSVTLGRSGGYGRHGSHQGEYRCRTRKYAGARESSD